MKSSYLDFHFRSFAQGRFALVAKLCLMEKNVPKQETLMFLGDELRRLSA